MPRGSNKVGRYKKHGTNNVDQAAARDEAAATAAAAVQRAAAEALLAMESPAAVVHPSPATAVQPRPNTVAQEERRRQAIVWKYEQLGSPPQELWRGPGGTLSIIRVWLELPYTADVRPIERVLERHVEGQPLKLAGQGRKAKLTHVYLCASGLCGSRQGSLCGSWACVNSKTFTPQTTWAP